LLVSCLIYIENFIPTHVSEEMGIWFFMHTVAFTAFKTKKI